MALCRLVMAFSVLVMRRRCPERDAHAFNFRAPAAPVYDDRSGRLVGVREDAHLFQRLGQGVAVIGVARHGAHGHDQTFFDGCGNALTFTPNS